MKLSSSHFRKINFTEEQIHKYLQSAQKDLHIAESTKIAEVIFKFSYDALIKTGITLIAKEGYRVRSKQGHHIKIIETLSKILGDEDIEPIANSMRTKRNFDLYGGGVLITKKQSEEYLKFIKKVFKKAKKHNPSTS